MLVCVCMYVCGAMGAIKIDTSNNEQKFAEDIVIHHYAMHIQSTYSSYKSHFPQRQPLQLLIRRHSICTMYVDTGGGSQVHHGLQMALQRFTLSRNACRDSTADSMLFGKMTVNRVSWSHGWLYFNPISNHFAPNALCGF